MLKIHRQSSEVALFEYCNTQYYSKQCPFRMLFMVRDDIITVFDTLFELLLFSIIFEGNKSDNFLRVSKSIQTLSRTFLHQIGSNGVALQLQMINRQKRDKNKPVMYGQIHNCFK